MFIYLIRQHASVLRFNILVQFIRTFALSLLPNAVREPPGSKFTLPEAMREPPGRKFTLPNAVREPPESKFTLPEAVREPPGALGRSLIISESEFIRNPLLVLDVDNLASDNILIFTLHKVSNTRI